MIRKLLTAIFLILGTTAYCQFGLYASAAFIKVNGSSSFYNNTAPGLGQDIGTTSFQGTDFGVFEQNSGNFILIGSEIKTFKGIADNVCSGTLNYTIYPSGARPVSPVYSTINLGFYSDCFAPTCGSFFGSYNTVAGGGCCSERDQKWQNPGFGSAANIDLTANPAGIYTLEIYYSYTGEDGGNGCITTKFDNNNNNPTNYTASFTLTNPAPVSFGNIRVTNNQSFNNISWTTYSEEQTSIFKLERSENGISFLPIKEIPAAGFSSTLRSYTLPDMNPIKGINYYRVKMIETNGKFKYSPIVKTDNKFKNNWYILNNPARENIQIRNIVQGDQVIIYNVYGAEISRNISKDNYLNISTNTIADGIYFIKLMNDKNNGMLQVIIHH